MNTVKRSCENCGNHACRNNVVAIWYDACVRDGFTVPWQPQTNGDRIRAMTDEQLAEVIMCPCDNPSGECAETGCIACCLDWLKQPAEVE